MGDTVTQGTKEELDDKSPLHAGTVVFVAIKSPNVGPRGELVNLVIRDDQKRTVLMLL